MQMFTTLFHANVIHYSNMYMWEIPPKFIAMAKLCSITAINEINIYKYVIKP